MNPQHIAVMSVLGLQTLKPVEVGVMDMANAFLRKADHEPMNIKEFKQVLKEVKTTSATFKDGKMTAKRKLPNMNDEQTAKFLGDKSLFLIHKPARIKKDKIVEVEFNCDGKGGIRLPNGEITNKSLVELVMKFTHENGIEVTHASETTKYAWKINPDKHPEIKGKRNMHIKRYLQDYVKG